MLINYLKIALKVLRRRKFFTFISLFGISFTLAVLVVVAALFQNVLSVVKPESRSARSLSINFLRFGHSDRPGAARISSPGYLFLDRHIRPMEGSIAGIENITVYATPTEVTAFNNGEKYLLNLRRTDGRYWEVLNFDFLEGGPFHRDDEARGNHVAVINQATRDGYFRGGPAVGREIEVDGQVFRVVGVVRNVPVYRTASYSDIWVPIGTAKSSSFRNELMSGFATTILAESPRFFPAIKQAVQEQLPRIAFPQPERWNSAITNAETRLESLAREMTNAYDRDPGTGKLVGLTLLFGFLFMLLPAINLININISRIMERASEIGIRKAFGATSRNLVGQFLLENLVLTAFGGLIGFLLAGLVLHLINRSGLIPYADFHLNLTVFICGLLLTLVFGAFAGVYPAWRMSRSHPVNALKGGAL